MNLPRNMCLVAVGSGYIRQTIARLRVAIYACGNILRMRELFCAVCARDHTRSQPEGNLQRKQPIVQVYGSLLNHTVIFILTQAVGGIIIHLGAGRDVLIVLRGLRVHALGTVVAFTHEGLVG